VHIMRGNLASFICVWELIATRIPLTIKKFTIMNFLSSAKSEQNSFPFCRPRFFCTNPLSNLWTTTPALLTCTFFPFHELRQDMSITKITCFIRRVLRHLRILQYFLSFTQFNNKLCSSKIFVITSW